MWFYRRIDDRLYWSSWSFREDSTPGIPGIMQAWRERKSAIANGLEWCRDDKGILRAYVPEMIRYLCSTTESFYCLMFPTWNVSRIAWPVTARSRPFAGNLFVKPANRIPVVTAMLVGALPVQKKFDRIPATYWCWIQQLYCPSRHSSYRYPRPALGR